MDWKKDENTSDIAYNPVQNDALSGTAMFGFVISKYTCTDYGLSLSMAEHIGHRLKNILTFVNNETQSGFLYIYIRNLVANQSRSR